jgi:hypothetical protein
MNPQVVYLKSAKGRDELSTRRDGLSPRLRALLVQVDGQHSVRDLAERNGGGADVYERLQQLIDGAYIVTTEAAASSAADLAGRPA